MQFLILRGHSRLVPQGGISEFPDAILNAKRLDLFNLYREVRFCSHMHIQYIILLCAYSRHGLTLVIIYLLSENLRE